MPPHHRIARVDNANKASRTIDQARAPQQPHKFPEVCLTTPGGGFLSLLYSAGRCRRFHRRSNLDPPVSRDPFMSRLSNEAPLAVDQPDLVHRVREVLDRVGFDEKHIYERFGVGEQGQLTLGPLDRPRLLWRTRDNDQLSTLLRVFL